MTHQIVKNGNSLELIKELPDNSIDMILTDPPYDGNATVYMDRITDMQKQTMAQEFKRLLNREGNLVLFSGFVDQFTWHRILTDLGFYFIRPLIWVYPNPTGLINTHSRKFISAHETILWFVKSDAYFFRSDTIVEKSWFLHNGFSGFIRLHGLENLPTEKLGVTPKPTKIALALINRLSKPHDTILDPFCGFGTFGVASRILKRNFIGYEIRPEITDIAQNRIEHEDYNPTGYNWINAKSENNMILMNCPSCNTPEIAERDRFTITLQCLSCNEKYQKLLFDIRLK